MDRPKPVYRVVERVQIQRSRVTGHWIINPHSARDQLGVRNFAHAIALARAQAAEQYDRRVFMDMSTGDYLLGCQLPEHCRPDADSLRALAEAPYA